MRSLLLWRKELLHRCISCKIPRTNASTSLFWRYPCKQRIIFLLGRSAAGELNAEIAELGSFFIGQRSIAVCPTFGSIWHTGTVNVKASSPGCSAKLFSGAKLSRNRGCGLHAQHSLILLTVHCDCCLDAKPHNHERCWYAWILYWARRS